MKQKTFSFSNFSCVNEFSCLYYKLDLCNAHHPSYMYHEKLVYINQLSLYNRVYTRIN